MFLETKHVQGEIKRIVGFLREALAPDERAVVGLSGGIDSDVTARLAARAVGPERLKLFTVLQADMEARHLAQARALAAELCCHLVEVDLSSAPRQFIAELNRADPVERFQPDGLLDPARAKISYRSLIACTYQDRGYVVIGTSNRTERLCGFFLPLGDGLWHLGPLAHLYKTEIFALARGLGSAPEVIAQQPSAGLWEGETDLEDLAFWLVNESPIGAQRPFDGAELELAASIRAHLTFERLDAALSGISAGRTLLDNGADCGLPLVVMERLERLVVAARRRKHRPLLTCLNRGGMPS